jgi:hypothetical protein
MAENALMGGAPQANMLSDAVEQIFGLSLRGDRPNVIPVPGEGGELIMPNWLYEAAKAVVLPSHVFKGGKATEEDIYDMALTAGVGSLAGSAPRGALRSGLARTASDEKKGIRAFHGSPHEFEKFELSERTMGTGEGSQAYGKGLYFAEEEKVAQNYRNLFEGQGRKGHMYEALIRSEPESFVDLRKPLKDQPDVVKDQLRPVAEYLNKDPETVTTAQLGAFLSHPKVIENLRKSGISGIRFLDRASREAGEGTWNYVVFDDELISIVRKYGWAGVVGGAAMATEGTD